MHSLLRVTSGTPDPPRHPLGIERPPHDRRLLGCRSAKNRTLVKIFSADGTRIFRTFLGVPHDCQSIRLYTRIDTIPLDLYFGGMETIRDYLTGLALFLGWLFVMAAIVSGLTSAFVG